MSTICIVKEIVHDFTFLIDHELRCINEEDLCIQVIDICKERTKTILDQCTTKLIIISSYTFEGCIMIFTHLEMLLI